MDDELLIEQVRENEALYNPLHKRYSDNAYKNAIWRNIGITLNKNSGECKSRWISLRDQFRKALRKKAYKYGQGSSSSEGRKWKYEKYMSFLVPFYKEREATGNTDNLDREESIDVGSDNIQILSIDESLADMGSCNAQLSITDPYLQCAEKSMPYAIPLENSTKIKKKRDPFDTSNVFMKCLLEVLDKEKGANSSSTDPIDVFFNSIAATVKTFTPIRQNVAKAKIFNIVSTLELEQLTESSTNIRQSQVETKQASSSS